MRQRIREAVRAHRLARARNAVGVAAAHRGRAPTLTLRGVREASCGAPSRSLRAASIDMSLPARPLLVPKPLPSLKPGGARRARAGSARFMVVARAGSSHAQLRCCSDSVWACAARTVHVTRSHSRRTPRCRPHRRPTERRDSRRRRMTRDAASPCPRARARQTSARRKAGGEGCSSPASNMLPGAPEGLHVRWRRASGRGRTRVSARAARRNRFRAEGAASRAEAGGVRAGVEGDRVIKVACRSPCTPQPPRRRRQPVPLKLSSGLGGEGPILPSKDRIRLLFQT
jgi:hypothetical protein